MGDSISTKKEKNDWIKEHMHKVEIIARQELKKWGKSVPLDELVAVGNTELVEAATRFDPTKGIKFWTYAETLVKGRIKDSIYDVVGRDKKSKIRKTVSLKPEDYEATYNHYEEHERKSNKEHFLGWLNKTETLTPAEKLLLELRYKEEITIKELARLVDSRPDELSKILISIQSRAQESYWKKREGDTSDYDSTIGSNELTKKSLSPKKPKKKSSPASDSKETDPLEKALDALDLFSFIWGNRPEDELLKEQLKACEKENPKFKETLDQLEEKGTNRFEIVKILAKNPDLFREEHYLRLKKAAEKDKMKQNINPRALADLFSKARNRKEQKKLFDLLPGMNEEHLERMRNELKEKEYDLSKISSSKPQIRPALTKTMVNLYDNLNLLCAYDPLQMEKIARKLVELYPDRLNQTPEEIKNTYGRKAKSSVEYKNEAFLFIAKLMKLYFKELCPNLTSAQVKSRIQNSLTTRL
jgi:RNA polymerase sigma factor (sigma-70 family)